MELDDARYAEIIGKRAERYLVRFRRFAERGEWLSWNWAAFFGTLAWLQYRRLYGWSWLYFFFSTPMLILAALLPVAGDACAAALSPATPYIQYAIEALIAASWIVPPLFADRLYYNHVRRLASADKPPAQRAGTGGIASTLAVQAIVLLGVVLFLPGHSSYAYRVRVSEGVSLASAARTPLMEYWMEHKSLPAELGNLAATSGTYVSKLELVDRGTIRATFGDRAARLAGHSVEVVPAWKGDQMVEWTCRSRDLPNACLPASCRATQ